MRDEDRMQDERCSTNTHLLEHVSQIPLTDSKVFHMCHWSSLRRATRSSKKKFFCVFIANYRHLKYATANIKEAGIVIH